VKKRRQIKIDLKTICSNS